VRVCPLPAAAGRPRAPGGAPRLLFLGRFEPIKGPDLLLEACARVPAGRFARVTLAGAGSLEPKLRARARSLPHPVEFAGVLSGRTKLEAIQRAGLLVVPSRRMADGRSEGLPHAALEALAAGTAVVAPAEGALGELLRRTGAGIAFEPHPEERVRLAGLAGALNEISLAPTRLAALAARAREAGRAFQAPAALPSWEAFLSRRAPGLA